MHACLACIRETTWFEDPSISEWTVNRGPTAMGHELAREMQGAQERFCLKWSCLGHWVRNIQTAGTMRGELLTCDKAGQQETDTKSVGPFN